MTAIRAGVVGSDLEWCIQLWLRAVEHRDGTVDSDQVSARLRAKLAGPVVRLAVATEPGPGFAVTADHGHEPGAAMLDLLAVAPGAAGHGIGRALLRDAVDHARAGGYQWLDLDVRTGNARAIRLYESAGFRPISAPTPHPLGGDPMVTYRLGLARHPMQGGRGEVGPVRVTVDRLMRSASARIDRSTWMMPSTPPSARL